MSLTVDSPSPARSGNHHRAPGDAAEAARICAAWARSGGFDEYVVYERDHRWVFAAGVRARIVLTASAVTVTHDDVSVTTPWHTDPSAALAAALASLEIPDWRVYGWVVFDYSAAHHDLQRHVPDDAVLAQLIVPEVEAHVDAAGIDTGDADPAVASLLRELAASAAAPGPATPVAVDSDPDGYRGRVGAAVAEIGAGRYDKVILSRRVDIPFAVDLPATYARGRAGNTPARSFLLSLGSLAAAGFSPELVVAADSDGTVVTEPLAGTRALGRSGDLDESARAELLRDAKEISEHAISVRACVDEIASVALPGTTVVSEFMAVRERGSVAHLASTVRGELAPDADAWRALAVLFPSITASGIPKARALDAIYRLEPDTRGLYSGAVLTASSAGDLEATLALRTVFATDDGAWLRAGAGIVAQSTPEREFEETCEKLASVAPFVVRRDRSADQRCQRLSQQ
ncbi:salicylate synthase [Gordonia rhizosphera]|uniref:Putative salicylate synthetase n=1 Tax=Gordonia rhizosphera NBRC 16068 TaxID=1108045 RepID=K6WDI8_9ACTN|nr:salicylate synthase [Gordonia rhizosphera]GAB90257.1 putative salicylate synthetase [Gordonia rhizosphera NBRC 16068]